MQPIEIRHWRERPVNRQLISHFIQELKLDPVVAQVMAHRNFSTTEEVEAFFDLRLSRLPDPSLMQDMDKAATRLAEAVEKGEGIAIHGDYDVDGITGCALLVEALRSMGASPEFFIPLRLRDGYGLSAEALSRAHQRGAQVAVSVDCGVTAVEEAELAKKLGLDLIITDHHQPSDRLPPAFAVIDPHRDGDAFPHKEIAGVGVAFFLIVALRRKLRERGWFQSRPEPDVRDLLDLVALGTVADVAPMTGVNRLLVRAGLKIVDGNKRVGITALKKAAGVKEASAGTIGFQLGPRINAAGRLDDAGRAVELLLTGDDARAREIAAELDNLNAERQALERQVLDEAVATVEQGPEVPAIVIGREGWHSGVVGIVASRLVERFYRPTFLIALEDGVGKGSGRSAGQFDLYEGLAACNDQLQSYGGHRAAAGLTLEEGCLDDFAKAFQEVVDKTWPLDERVPQLEYDGTVRLDQITFDTLKSLQQMGPHGIGNPTPLLHFEGLRASEIRVVGENHLKFRVTQGQANLECIAFSLADKRSILDQEVDILAVPEVNRWRGRQSIQLRVRDIQGS